MTIIRHIATLSFILAISACQSNRPGLPDAQASQLNLDWVGRYQGILPCADCPGIATEIRLFPAQQQSALGKAIIVEHIQESTEAPTTTTTNYQWADDGKTLRMTGESGETRSFYVGKNHLIQLDPSGQHMSEDMADTYRLTQLSDVQALTGGLFPIDWRISSLNDQPLSDFSTRTEPTLRFNSNESFNGHTGCNYLRGQLQISGNRMQIESLFTTRKACPNGSAEPILLSALNSVYRYRLVSEDTLRLFDETGSLLISLTSAR